VIHSQVDRRRRTSQHRVERSSPVGHMPGDNLGSVRHNTASEYFSFVIGRSWVRPPSLAPSVSDCTLGSNKASVRPKIWYKFSDFGESLAIVPFERRNFLEFSSLNGRCLCPTDDPFYRINAKPPASERAKQSHRKELPGTAWPPPGGAQSATSVACTHCRKTSAESHAFS